MGMIQSTTLANLNVCIFIIVIVYWYGKDIYGGMYKPIEIKSKEL